MATRKGNLLVPLVSGGNYQPDTGRVVTVQTDETVPVTVATATENPASSGNYEATWTCTNKYGYWYIDGSKKEYLGRFWLGEENKSRPSNVNIFRKVEVYDAADTPSGAKGAQKTFTTGTSPLATDSDGNTSFNYTTIPLVFICNPYQERGAFISTDPSLSGANVTFGISAHDVGTDYSDGKTYVDILIIRRD